MPNEDSVGAAAGIEYRRGRVQVLWSYDVWVADALAETRLCDWLYDMGWRLLNRDPEKGGWLLHFTHTDLVADTDRLDAVRIDRQWPVVEVKV